MAGAGNVKTQNQVLIILGIGSAVTVLFAMVLARTPEELDILLGNLLTDAMHPATLANNRAKWGGSRRRLIGIGIPRLCRSLLLLVFVLSLVGVLHVPTTGPPGGAPRWWVASSSQGRVGRVGGWPTSP